MEIKHKACPCPNCIAVLSLLVNLWVDCPQFLSLSKKKHLLVLYTERERERESHTVTDGWIKDAVGFGRVAEERRGAKDAHHLAMTNHLFPYKSYTGHHHTQMVKKGWVIFTAHTVPAKKKKNCMVPWTKFTVDYGHVHRHITTMGPWPARCGLRPMVSSCSCVDLFLALQQQTWRIFISPNDLFF